MHHVFVRLPEPEKLRVLYLTADPDPERPLRTDAEVNNVLKALRGARHRDLIDLQQRPAATPQDIMDGVNDLRPHVIHFSGHGGGQGLSFDTASLEEPHTSNLSFDVLARVIGATDTPPTLVVLNACDTLDGAELLLEVAPVVIAMADEVGDITAGLFASQFYAAIASAQSVGSALRQAKAMMAANFLEHADLPQHLSRAGVDIDTLILVRPEEPDAG